MNEFEFNKEVKQKISLKKAFANPDNLVDQKSVEKILEEGKEIHPYLMKNYWIAYKIQNQLLKYADNWNLSNKEIYAGNCFKRDYELANISTHARADYESVGRAAKNEEIEPNNKQIDALKNIKQVKCLFAEKSKIKPIKTFKSFKKNKSFKNIIKPSYTMQDYYILEKFIGEDWSLRKIGEYFNMHHETMKKRLLESLQLLLNLYICA